jgi:hypothetical protein
MNPSVPLHEVAGSYGPVNATIGTRIFPESMPTAALLDINESTQPEAPFSYLVYQGQDSGYQSLEQPPDPEVAEPFDYDEFLETTAEQCDTAQQDEQGMLWPIHPDGADASVDLAGLEMEPSQFPSDAKISRRGRKGMEHDI